MLICYIGRLIWVRFGFRRAAELPDSVIDSPVFARLTLIACNRNPAQRRSACRPVVKFDAFLKKLSRGAEIFFQIRKSRRSARKGCKIPRPGAILGPDETPYNHYPFLHRG